MELYVIRHALAEPLGRGNDFSDEKRALTEEGRRRMREAASGLRKLGIEIDLILSSPLVRALETAEIVAAGLNIAKKHLRQSGNLMPGASAKQLFAEIKKHAGIESIALVGHQPDLGNLVSSMIKAEAGALSIQLKKGSVCCLNITETVPTLHGELMWLLTSKHLRMLAKV